MVKKIMCDKHGEYEEHVVNVCGFELVQSCPKCIDEWELAEELRIKEAAKQTEITWQMSARIPKEFYEKSFDNYVVITDSQNKAVKMCQEMIKRQLNKIVLIGTNGTGKSHLAISILKKLSGEYWTMFEISARIRSTYTKAAIENELDILNNLCALPCLVIDEIGRTKGSESELNWLSHIIGKRHSNFLPTILISNCHQRKNCKNNGCEKCIENYLGNDVISRLQEDTEIIEIIAKDYRGLKK
jgi:DNA replication protein DnaC